MPTPYSNASSFCLPDYPSTIPSGLSTKDTYRWYNLVSARDDLDYLLGSNSTDYCFSVSDQSSLMNSIASYGNYPTRAVDSATTGEDISQYLIDHREDYQASQIGAYRYTIIIIVVCVWLLLVCSFVRSFAI